MTAAKTLTKPSKTALKTHPNPTSPSTRLTLTISQLQRNPNPRSMSSPSTLSIPRPTWPHRPVTYILLILLFLQTVICLTPPSNLPGPIHRIQSFALTIFHTQASLKLFLLFTISVHLLEALYALSLLRRVTRSLDGKAILWALQTALVGFPSLILLMEKLAKKP